MLKYFFLFNIIHIICFRPRGYSYNTDIQSIHAQVFLTQFLISYAIIPLKKLKKLYFMYLYMYIRTYLNPPFSFNEDDFYARPSFQHCREMSPSIITSHL